jgi:hypothetical protein
MLTERFWFYWCTFWIIVNAAMVGAGMAAGWPWFGITLNGVATVWCAMRLQTAASRQPFN